MDQQTSEALQKLVAIFEKVKQGDFSEEVSLPEEASQLAPVISGINELLSVIRKQQVQLDAEMAAREQIQDVCFRQEQDFKVLIEDSPDIIARFDRELRHVYVNPAIEKVTGIPASSFIGKTNKDLSMPLEQEHYWAENINKVFQTGKEARIEFSFQGPDHSTRYFQARLVPEVDKKGTVAYVLGVSQDITELKKHAEAINNAKDQFISLVSHELRTPLTAIKGLISMILTGDYGEISDRMRQPLLNVYTSSQRQIVLINALLNISRLKTGRIRYTLSQFLPQMVVKDVVSAFESQARLKGLEFSVDQGEQILVQADSLWVRDIMDNLVSNAIKFTESGKVHISYRYEGDQVMLVVTDTGTGMTEEEQQKLFGKFEQIITPEKGKAVGSGLGLFISRAVARKMGGDVVLEKSQPGQGSAFILLLPKAESKQAILVRKELEKTNELALNKIGG